MTIATNSGTQTIDGASTYRLFATYQSSLSLTNLLLQNGLARGGAGGTASTVSMGTSASVAGGGGGLGAGGGVCVDLGQTITLTNTSITACTAQGGAGGSIGVGFPTIGAGASWSINSKEPSLVLSGSSGDGDYPGIKSSKGITSEGISGYGGGQGAV